MKPSLTEHMARFASSRTVLDAVVTCAIISAAVLAGCENREQKPKVTPSAIAPIGVAAAQQADRVVPPTAISGAMHAIDEAFALFAASSGLAEIAGARLVLKTTKSADVRDYAQKLVRDYMRGAEDLKRVVAPRGLALPAAPTGRHADLITKLSGVRGEDLDEAFLQRLGVDAHKEAISLFERHVSEGKDPELKRYAERTLTMLREHMAAAHKLLYAASAGR